MDRVRTVSRAAVSSLLCRPCAVVEPRGNSRGLLISGGEGGWYEGQDLFFSPTPESRPGSILNTQ